MLSVWFAEGCEAGRSLRIASTSTPEWKGGRVDLVRIRKIRHLRCLYFVNYLTIDLYQKCFFTVVFEGHLSTDLDGRTSSLFVHILERLSASSQSHILNEPERARKRHTSMMSCIYACELSWIGRVSPESGFVIQKLKTCSFRSPRSRWSVMRSQ